MKVIGIAGGVASGKSLVAKQLAELGAWVLDADQVGHAVLKEPEVIQAIRDRWGATVLDSQGRVIRREVAKIVFHGPQAATELAFLEALTHPRIGERLAEIMEQHRRQQQTPALVLDAALMFKGGWDRLCDVIVFVDTPRARRLQWARQRGWNERDFDAREASQTPVNAKRTKADVVIDNSGTLEQTRNQVHEFWKTLNQQPSSHV